jgi:hypothetical protein
MGVTNVPKFGGKQNRRNKFDSRHAPYPIKSRPYFNIVSDDEWERIFGSKDEEKIK